MLGCYVVILYIMRLYAVCCYIMLSDLREKEDSLVLMRPETFSPGHLLVSMLLCVLAVFCKEQGITVIVSTWTFCYAELYHQ